MRALLFASAAFASCLLGCGSSSEEEPIACDPAPAGESVPFIDATASLGVDVAHHFASDFCEITDSVGGPGVCMIDYDSDGDLDLYFVDRAPYANTLLRNDGGAFADVTAQLGVGDGRDSVGCLAFDADGDGDTDLFVSNHGRDTFYENEGGVFSDATEAFGLGDLGFSTSATAGDIDGDGDMDLFVGRLVDTATCPEAQCHLLPLACTSQTNLLYINEGKHFTQQAAARGLTPGEPSLASLLFDFEGDGDLDLYIGNDMGIAYADRLMINDGMGFFIDQGAKFGFDAFGTDTMGVDVGDYDGDGLLEMVTTDFKDKPIRLYDCYSAGFGCSFENVGPDSLPYVKWGVGLVDFDADRDLDLFVTSGDVYYEKLEGAGDPNRLYWNDGRGELTQAPSAPGEALADAQISRGVAFGDLDGDGDVDVVVANANGKAQVLLNQATRGHTLTIALDSHSAGARVTATVEAGELTEQALVGGSYLSSSDPRVFFGLGDACAADVTVVWPGGQTKTMEQVLADQVLVVTR